jgi:hypothetical protein
MLKCAKQQNKCYCSPQTQAHQLTQPQRAKTPTWSMRGERITNQTGLFEVRPKLTDWKLCKYLGNFLEPVSLIKWCKTIII